MVVKIKWCGAHETLVHETVGLTVSRNRLGRMTAVMRAMVMLKRNPDIVTSHQSPAMDTNRPTKCIAV